MASGDPSRCLLQAECREVAVASVTGRRLNFLIEATNGNFYLGLTLIGPRDSGHENCPFPVRFGVRCVRTFEHDRRSSLRQNFASDCPADRVTTPCHFPFGSSRIGAFD